MATIASMQMKAAHTKQCNATKLKQMMQLNAMQLTQNNETQCNSMQCNSHKTMQLNASQSNATHTTHATKVSQPALTMHLFQKF